MTNAQHDLKEIREMMERSSRFMSLSGISGIIIGILALAYCLYAIVSYDLDPLHLESFSLLDDVWLHLYFYGAVLCAVSIFIATALTILKTRKQKLPVWSRHSRNMMLAMFIPLICGGLVLLEEALHYQAEHFFSYTLIFYGLGLSCASTYSLKELRWMGYFEILLGLSALFHPDLGMVFWAVGFGILHIIYGTLMHYYYER